MPPPPLLAGRPARPVDRGVGLARARGRAPGRCGAGTASPWPRTGPVGALQPERRHRAPGRGHLRGRLRLDRRTAGGDVRRTGRLVGGHRCGSTGPFDVDAAAGTIDSGLRHESAGEDPRHRRPPGGGRLAARPRRRPPSVGRPAALDRVPAGPRGRAGRPPGDERGADRDLEAALAGPGSAGDAWRRDPPGRREYAEERVMLTGLLRSARPRDPGSRSDHRPDAVHAELADDRAARRSRPAAPARPIAGRFGSGAPVGLGRGRRLRRGAGPWRLASRRRRRRRWPRHAA